MEWLKYIPDPRSSRKKKYDQAEVLCCIVLAFLAGKRTLRRIRKWCIRHLDELRKHMKMPNGVPSLPTLSRMLAAIDGELLATAFICWIGEIIDTRNIHIAIDGKGLRAAAKKLLGERTPYILNAVDAKTGVVIGVYAIPDKTNEMTAIPELLELLNVEGSTVTIDAIGTTGNIMEALCAHGADFVLQVKKNCPALYQELMDLSDGMEKERKQDCEAFKKKYGEIYSSFDSHEKNRERHEYRNVMAVHDDGLLAGLKDDRPYIRSVGQCLQVRIKKIMTVDGEDITPGREEFIRNGSKKQPKPVEGDGTDDAVQKTGLISSREMDAEEMARYKRKHWSVENSLHYVLDEDFGEDRCTVRKGKNALSVLRKAAYNIVRLLQMGPMKEMKTVPEVLDELENNLALAMRYVFRPIPSFY